jgi:hypothetical protein
MQGVSQWWRWTWSLAELILRRFGMKGMWKCGDELL